MKQIETEILLCAEDSPTELLLIIINILKKLKRSVSTANFKALEFGDKNILQYPWGVTVDQMTELLSVIMMVIKLQYFPKKEYLFHNLDHMVLILAKFVIQQVFVSTTKIDI